tara:strand:- start:18 stop:416 length:399 start_codon:yes stop_codon:yes gene_type:complete
MDLKMTIAYKKKYLNLNLIYALLFTVTLFTVDLKSEENWKLIIGILVPASFISKYFYQKQKKYLTIENNKIKVNNIFGSEINLNEIFTIERYAGDYILKTGIKKLKIDTTIIAPVELSNLNSELEKLNVKWE